MYLPASRCAGTGGRQSVSGITCAAALWSNICLIRRSGVRDSGGRVRQAGGTELVCQPQAPENLQLSFRLTASVPDDFDCPAQPSHFDGIAFS